MIRSKYPNKKPTKNPTPTKISKYSVWNDKKTLPKLNSFVGISYSKEGRVGLVTKANGRAFNVKTKIFVTTFVL